MSESAATDRNVYILGAGFSADAGAPVVRNFLDRSREILDDPSSGMTAEERSAFQEVFDFRRKVAQAREKVVIDLDDIEQLFGLVEMSCRLGKASDSLRASTVYLIAKTLQLTTSHWKTRRPNISFMSNKEVLAKLNVPVGFETAPGGSPTEPQFIVDIYAYFAAMVSGQLDEPKKREARADTVITFNYDLVLDQALRRIGVKRDYHLPETLVHDDEQAEFGQTISLLKASRLCKLGNLQPMRAKHRDTAGKGHRQSISIQCDEVL